MFDYNLTKFIKKHLMAHGKNPNLVVQLKSCGNGQNTALYMQLLVHQS